MAFESSGYDDWPQLKSLDNKDLDAIARHGNITLLPGHRKKILLAARQLEAEGKLAGDKFLNKVCILPFFILDAHV